MVSLKDLPFRVILDSEQEDAILAWGIENESNFHELATVSAVALHKNTNMEGIVVVEFFESYSDIEPWSDIYMERDEIENTLEDAELFFVSIEDYEKAQWVKNYRDKLV
jgi:hypothetical protein